MLQFLTENYLSLIKKDAANEWKIWYIYNGNLINSNKFRKKANVLSALKLTIRDLPCSCGKRKIFFSLFFRYFESTVKNYIYSNSTFLTQHKSKCKLDVIFASLFCLIYIFGVLYILDKILHENLADNLVIGI